LKAVPQTFGHGLTSVRDKRARQACATSQALKCDEDALKKNARKIFFQTGLKNLLEGHNIITASV
jgi:hypothetical protein